MRKLYLSVIAVLAGLSSFAASITASVTGNWTNPGIWTINGTAANRVPQTGDIITIQPTATVTLSNGTTTSLSNVQLNVSGTLSLSTNSTILALTYSSVTVNSGSITRQGSSPNNTQDLTVGGNSIFPTTGSSKNNVNSGSYGTYWALPVKFSDFSVARQNSDVLVQWSTAEEVNAKAYEVERSSDGFSWTRVTTTAAKGNSSSLTNYSYTDKNVTASVAYYRIKQVDLDGKFTFTPVQSVTSVATAVDVKVTATNNRIVLQFSGEVKGAVEVRLVSMGGQVVSREVINQPVGQVVLNNAPAKGSYIVSVSNAKDINVSKQVVL